MLPYTLNTFSNLKSSKLICRFLCVDIRTLKSCLYFNWYFEEDISMTRFKVFLTRCRVFLSVVLKYVRLLINFHSTEIRLYLQFSDQFRTNRNTVWLGYQANNFIQTKYKRKVLQNNCFNKLKLIYHVYLPFRATKIVRSKREREMCSDDIKTSNFRNKSNVQLM